MDLLTIGFAVCVLLGLACFGLFYLCVEWFDKI